MRKTLGVSLLFCALVGAQQPPRQEDPNARYRTREGREAVANSLDNPNRAEEMKLRDLVTLMKVKPGDAVADIGTGTGVFLPILSAAVGPKGRVYAQDIFPDFLERTRNKVMKEKLANVTLVLGSERSPMLPANVDVVVTIDAYHHFEFPVEMLAGVRESLAAKGRFVVVDFYHDKGPGPGHVAKDRDSVAKEVEGNGFKLESKSELNARQYVLIFSRK